MLQRSVFCFASTLCFFNEKDSEMCISLKLNFLKYIMLIEGKISLKCWQFNSLRKGFEMG